MELLSICGPELLKAGYEVLVYHPYAPDLSDAWNMLSYAKDFESVDDMVLAIIANTGTSKDNYWDNQTNQLLDLICYHLQETLGEKASMSHVQALAGAASARDIEVTLKNSPNQKIKMNAAGFFSRIGENEKLISSITSDLPRRLKLWTLDPIRATTHVNEIDFSVLCTDKKVVLFVVTPMDKKEQLKPLFATFFTQLCKVVQEKGRELGRLPRPLWFLLDEFPNLGAIPNFDNFLTVVRGYNVGVVLGIQSRSQLAELYGDDRAKTIIEACATYIVFPRIGAEDAKYFSDMLGKRTVLTIEKSYNRHLFVTDWKHKEEEKAVARPLLGPDEIRALDKDNDLIVLAGTRRPVRIFPAFYFKDPRWAALGEECRDENNLKARRSVFYRANRGKPPLDVPGEEQMMAEAAVLTAAALGKKGRKQEQVPAEQQKPDVPKTTAPAAGTQQGPVPATETRIPVPATKMKIRVNLRRQREWAARWHEKREKKKKSPALPDNGEKQDKEQKPGPAKAPPVLRIDDGKLFKR
jgi:type IV secretory pathway TraG/TraD family ATPase VirD4